MCALGHQTISPAPGHFSNSNYSDSYALSIVLHNISLQLSTLSAVSLAKVRFDDLTHVEIVTTSCCSNKWPGIASAVIIIQLQWLAPTSLQSALLPYVS